MMALSPLIMTGHHSLEAREALLAEPRTIAFSRHLPFVTFIFAFSDIYR